MNNTYVDPPLQIIRPPRPPQRILLAPKPTKVKSTSNMPEKEQISTVDYEETRRRQSASILKAIAPPINDVHSRPPIQGGFKTKTGRESHNTLVHAVSLEERHKLSYQKLVNSAARSVPNGSNWISNLTGKPFSTIITTINFHHMPYRIVKIDEIYMPIPPKSTQQEILLEIITNEQFTKSRDPKTALFDHLRAQSWFSINNDKAIILSAKLS
jgi:hypothetical protein